MYKRQFEGTDAFAPPGRITYRSLQSIRTALAHETGGETQEQQESPDAGPKAGGGGTAEQRLIVLMVEVAAFRVHVDDYPPEEELDSITHGSGDLPDGAGGLTLRQRATIALLRSGARRHVPRPRLECKPLCQLSYLDASYATSSDWGLGDTAEYVSVVPTPSSQASLSVRQTMGRLEQPEGTLMKHHDDVKRALTTPEYFASGSSGCGEGHALAEKSTWFLIRMQPDKHPLVRYGKCGLSLIHISEPTSSVQPWSTRPSSRLTTDATTTRLATNERRRTRTRKCATSSGRSPSLPSSSRRSLMKTRQLGRT